MPVQVNSNRSAKDAAAAPAQPQAAAGDGGAADAPAGPEPTAAAPANDTASPPAKRAKVELGTDDADGEPGAANAAATDTDMALRWEIRGGGRRGRPDSKGLKHRDLDPVIPVTDDSILGPVREFYGLEESFPLSTHLVTRCMEAAGRPKRCYYVSDAVRRLLMLDESESLVVIQVGLKVHPRRPPTLCRQCVLD